MKINRTQYAVWTGLLLCTAVGAYAVPVTFQVNMTYQISQGNFTPGNRVSARGSFNGWGTFDLVDNGTGVYTNTTEVAGSPGDTVYYKYWNNGTAGTSDNYESVPNRSFTLAGSAQSAPLVYFNDIFGGGPEIAVTFQVDMSVQITKGAFNTGTDTVEARGSFQSPNGWAGAPNAFYLYNNGANVYTNTYGISNTPPNASFYYKFFMATNNIDTGSGYEGVANRGFLMPTSAATIPKVYFDDQLPLTNLITFQVDMEYVVNRTAITNVDARGSFQSPAQWTGGFSLTNNPAAANPYLYTGTYNNSQLPGTVQYFKYTYQNTNNADVHWENDPNRAFTLVANSQTLPEVLFNNVSTNDFVAQDTLVTFTVSMTNAHSYTGFNPLITFDKSMAVAINGDWIPWWNWAAAAPSAYGLTNGTGGDWLYSQSLLMPKGTALQLTYKFGIDDGANNLDNEAGFATNHIRFIRNLGTYTMPLDTFGTPVTEPEVGALTVGTPSAGHIPVSWLGVPTAYLQTSTDVANPAAWVSHPETKAYGSPSGIYSTNYPMSSGPLYFRVVKP
jgi:hypothetical protein